MHSCPGRNCTHTHLRIRCRSKISMCLDTLITREQERMNGTERFGLCVVWPRSREGKKQNSKQEFATNCTFLSTMISFFENFTSASVQNYNYNNNNNQIITFYSGLVRSHATPAASFRYTHTHTRRTRRLEFKRHGQEQQSEHEANAKPKCKKTAQNNRIRHE